MNDTAKKPELALSEAPIEEIRELATRMPNVALTIKRRNGRGSMGFVAGMVVCTTDLADGALERVLGDQYGGGEFHIVALNPENRMEQVLPKYSTSVDGVPKIGQSGSTDPRVAQREQRNLTMQMPLAQHAVPIGAIPGQPFFQQSGITPPPVPTGRDFMQRLPDEIASEQAYQLREDVQKLQAQMEDQQRRSENRIEGLRAENERLRLEQREREADHLKALHEARFRDLELKLMNPAKPAFDATAITGLIAALVPVFTAMINASKDRAALMVNQQQNAATLQMEGIKTMVTAQSSKKPDFDLKSLIELGTPLFTAFISGRDPSKMADLMTAMGENQLGLLSLVGNIMSQVGGESESPMMRVLQEAVAGAVNVAERMAASREAPAPVQAQVQARRLPPTPQPVAAPQPAAQPPRRRVGAVTAPAPAAVEAPTTPDQLARMLLADEGWPAAMRTPAWHAIIRDIHDPAAPVPATALAVGRALDALYDAGRLPSQLVAIFDDSAEELPANAKAFFDALPVGQGDPARAAALTAALVEVFTPQDDADDAAPAAAAATNGAEDPVDDAADQSDDGADEDGVLPASN